MDVKITFRVLKINKNKEKKRRTDRNVTSAKQKLLQVIASCPTFCPNQEV